MSKEYANDFEQNISVLNTQQKQSLSSWGLPDVVLKRYELLGVVSMFQWQVECLSNVNVLTGSNLIYSAPTSAGKTLIAEILVIKTVLERKKKAIIILPFVSVVREKMFYFQNLLSSSGVRVAGLMGSRSLPGGFKSVDLAICTIEKANSLINRLLEEDNLHKVGMVVVDELHLLGDPFRGYLLELLLTKILYMCKSNEEINIQIIGMSATLPNLPLLATWLGADLYQTDFRPVPLKEFLKIGPTVYDIQLNKLYDIPPSKDIQDDPDHVVQLCLETLLQGHSVLIFCPTKQWCERLSQRIAQVFRTIGLSGSNLGQELRKQLNSSAIAEALEQLQRCPVGLDKYLGCSVAFGVAFHHAGLTLDERDILESCFRSGTLRVLVATSTLSSGVNLPARRVIVRSPMFHGKCIDTETYKQMIGRAGRTGRDTLGESFLVCSKTEEHIGKRLIKSDLTPVESCLGHGKMASSLKRAILEVIASGVASTPQQVAQYTSLTLLATTKSELQNPISACVQFLEDNELIRLQKDGEGEEKYIPTSLGLACLSASIPPDEGLQLFSELSKARHCFVLDTDLHIIYEVTPYSICSQWGNLDWLHVLNIWEKLPASMQKVGELVGVEEGFMARALRGTLSLTSSRQLQKMSIHRRFYTALALNDLVNEVPLNEVAVKYGCSRGMLQSLQQSAATFAGMVTAFCKRLGWSSVELLISQFQDRLQFGVQRELCDLMKLDALNAQRARALFDDGITSLADLAVADVCAVENALHKSIPFQSSKELNGETSFETKQRNKLRNVWVTGHEGLTERDAALLLISEARTYLQKELGLKEAKWDSPETDSSGYDSQSPSQKSYRSQNQFSINNGIQFTESCNDKNKDEQSSTCHNQSIDVCLNLPCLENSKRMLEQNKNGSKSSVMQRNETAFVHESEKHNSNRRQSSSQLSDEDCLSSSPIQNSSKRNNRTKCSKLGRYRISKQNRISQNAGAIKSAKSKMQNSHLMKTHSSVSKQCKIIISNLNQPEETSNKANNMNETLCKSRQIEKHENLVVLQKNRTDGNLVSSGKEYVECKSTNQSIDYFDSPLDISESKLHEKTQNYHYVKTILKSSISSHDVSSEIIRGNLDDNRKVNEIEDAFQNSISAKASKECTSSVPSLEQLEKLEENILNISGKLHNQRLSSDFFSSPTSVGKQAHIIENDDSPSLFGDSFVVDTQLDEVLDGRCNENEDERKLDFVNKKEMPASSISKHNVTNIECDNLTNKKNNIDHQYLEEESKLIEPESILRAAKHDTEVQIDVNYSKGVKKKKKISCSIKRNIQTLPEGIITSRDFMKLRQKAETSEIVDLYNTKTNDRSCLNGETKLNTPRNSFGKMEDLGVEDAELPTVYDIQSEEIYFQSIYDESMLQTPLQKTKKGLVSLVTYDINEKLKSSSKNITRKRKIVSGVSENFVNGLDNNKKIRFSKDFCMGENCDNSENLVEEKQVITMEADSKNLSSSSVFDKNIQFLDHEAENIGSKDDDCITDSFLERAFDTCWELEESKENKNKNIKSSKIQNILQEKEENIQKKITSVCSEIKEGNKSSDKISSVISKSILEGAFNSYWEDDMTFKAENEANEEKYNSHLNSCENKVSDNRNIQDHQVVNYETVGSRSDANSSFRERKKSGDNKFNRRRSPRLLEAFKKRIKKEEEEGKEVSTKLLQSASDSYFKKSKTKNGSKIDEIKSLTTSINAKVVQSETPVTRIYSPNLKHRQESNFKEENILLCQKESVKHNSLKGIKANRILHFSDTSDDDIENDVIVSSQADEQTKKKRGGSSSKMEEVKLKLSMGELKSNSRSPAASHKKKINRKSSSIKSDVKLEDRCESLWNSVNIVDVCAHDKVWTAFQTELHNISISKVAFAVACEHFTDSGTPVSKNSIGIGARIIGHKQKKSEKTLQKDLLHYGEQLVSGIALCFGGKDAFFISFKQDSQYCVAVQNALKDVTNFFKRGMALCAFDLKEHLKLLARCCGIMLQSATGHDPKVADWLIEPEGREKNFVAMVLRYCGSEASKLADLVGTNFGVESPSLELWNDTSSRLRACIEAVLTWQIVEVQLSTLEEKNLINIYSEVEMPTLFCLTQMEINGIGFDKHEAERLRNLLEEQIMLLEQNAYKLAGHPFSLTSSADVAKVLYRELGLTKGKLSNKQRRPSTSKEVLIQIKNEHPLPGLILQWRKLNAMVTKTLFPLLVPEYSNGRIFTYSVIHTATGRISMHEPNLQNIPRDFDVIINEMKEKPCTSISMRLAFIPSSGKLFISADYSQLELRILAHLAKDSVLCSILNSDCDVFRNIAASWNKILETQVSCEQRQWAKQICYGILYGMGAKALGEQLGVDEEDASVFMDTFKNSYSGVKHFLLETITQCHKEGYIVTLLGRRRYLPSIHSTNSAIRAQAERQAVNSTVQGSAADIAKKGMILVESQLRNSGFLSVDIARKEFVRTANLVLHLHDELLYEVSQEHVMEAAHIIKCALENAVKLSVQLPVKVKIGESWGSLREVTI